MPMRVFIEIANRNAILRDDWRSAERGFYGCCYDRQWDCTEAVGGELVESVVDQGIVGAIDDAVIVEIAVSVIRALRKAIGIGDGKEFAMLSFTVVQKRDVGRLSSA
jgi:hypothetical protein